MATKTPMEFATGIRQYLSTLDASANPAKKVDEAKKAIADSKLPEETKQAKTAVVEAL